MLTTAKENLEQFIHAEWRREVPEAVNIAAKKIADKYGDAVCGVLFYGSCLRTGEIEDKILDFYVIVETYKAAYASRALAVANSVLPPNVFYHEIDVAGVTVRSKYAVLSLADLEYRASSSCLNVSVWARFCQPCLLLHEKDNSCRIELARHVASSVTTMLGNFIALKPEARSSGLAWTGAFEQTYASELRSEGSGKGEEIYRLDQQRYDYLTPLVFTVLEEKREVDKWPKATWLLRRWNGKTVSFLRLVKASVTFDGGIDYLAWKIRRHSGVEIEVVDWMRRHPVVAGIVLFWRLRKKGAFK